MGLIKAYFYDGTGRDREIVLKGALPKISPQQLLWIDVTGRGAKDIDEVAKLLNLDSRCATDLKQQDSEYRLNTYGVHLHFDVASLKLEEVEHDLFSQAPSALRLNFIVSKNWLLTVHREKLKFLEDFRNQDRGAL